ncbi:iron transporter [Halobacterium sp. NMX12-1]|uniref:Iron transporter n=1 Tax=Halobacterium sp. NMX12-1 TaxID=3166650 RepID=A0AAU8C9K5_9EURY
MRRRRFLALGSLASSALLAGCVSDTTDDATTEPPATTAPATTPATTAEKPDGVYVQSFEEQMAMQGTTTVGDYTVALLFTVPHTFWTLVNRDVSKTEKTAEDDIHLMAVVWDDETDTVVPAAAVSVELERGEFLQQEVLYPMLSQPMGSHYGDNFALDGDGTYDATVSIGAVAARKTGAFEGRFEDVESAEMTVEFTEETRARVGATPIEEAGEPGALAPRDTSYPKSIVPAPDDLPGTVRGTAAIDDAYYVVTDLASAERVGEPDQAYLAVSARTRYNGYELSSMALDATLVRDGETLYDDTLSRTLSPDLGLHLSAAVPSVESGDELTLSVRQPPQVGRHEGYETAFLDTESVTLTL